MLLPKSFEWLVNKNLTTLLSKIDHLDNTKSTLYEGGKEPFTALINKNNCTGELLKGQIGTYMFFRHLCTIIYHIVYTFAHRLSSPHRRGFPSACRRRSNVPLALGSRRGCSVEDRGRSVFEPPTSSTGCRGPWLTRNRKLAEACRSAFCCQTMLIIGVKIRYLFFLCYILIQWLLSKPRRWLKAKVVTHSHKQQAINLPHLKM